MSDAVRSPIPASNGGEGPSAKGGAESDHVMWFFATGRGRSAGGMVVLERDSAPLYDRWTGQGGPLVTGDRCFSTSSKSASCLSSQWSLFVIDAWWVGHRGKRDQKRWHPWTCSSRGKCGDDEMFGYTVAQNRRRIFGPSRTCLVLWV